MSGSIRNKRSPRSFGAIAAACLFVFFSNGCRRASDETAVNAYLAFNAAAQEGEAKVAWGLLSEPSRKLLEQKAEAVKQAADGAVAPDPAAIFFSQTARTAAVSEVKLIKDDGPRVELSVKTGEETASVWMVRETGGWRVDVASALEKQ